MASLAADRVNFPAALVTAPIASIREQNGAHVGIGAAPKQITIVVPLACFGAEIAAPAALTSACARLTSSDMAPPSCEVLCLVLYHPAVPKWSRRIGRRSRVVESALKGPDSGFAAEGKGR